MSTAQVQSPSVAAKGAADASRDAQGRFTASNPGGPGNPFARRTAAMRKAFSEAISLDDLKTLAQQLMAEALKGDKAAAKLVLQYGLGKPAPQPDPDRLDIEEWRQYREEAGMVPELPKMAIQPYLDVALDVVRTTRPAVMAHQGRLMGAALRDPAAFFAAEEKTREAEFRRREQADLRVAAKYEGFVPDEPGLPPEIKPIQPKGNGKNGGKRRGAAPSAKGQIGDPPRVCQHPPRPENGLPPMANGKNGCAAKRRRSSVGVIPTRQLSLQPVAIGAAR